MSVVTDFGAFLDWLADQGPSTARKTSKSRRGPEHPGTVLQRDFLAQQSMSQSELARRIDCTHAKVNDIIQGRRGISPRFALDLERVLGTPAALWLSLQAEYDLWAARHRRRVGRSSNV